MSIFGFSDTEGNGHLLLGEEHDFSEMRAWLADRLLRTEPANQGKWQTLDVSKSSAHDTYELLNVTMWYEMPMEYIRALGIIRPDHPWAENHFQERVGGKAINPGVEHANWPYHAHGADLHLNDEGKYDHNYMERMWPTDIGHHGHEAPFQGYRFPVGDLNDVVNLLRNNSGTRQAYLPIWFPEDTGATAGQRVPCSLGYHFIIRDNVLHVQYNLRSCEIYRHFTNDIYMAVRLAQWVAERLDNMILGQLTTHIVSLHGFAADKEKIEAMM